MDLLFGYQIAVLFVESVNLILHDVTSYFTTDQDLLIIFIIRISYKERNKFLNDELKLLSVERIIELRLCLRKRTVLFPCRIFITLKSDYVFYFQLQTIHGD